MIDRTTVAQWLRDYVSAWKSYDPTAISALFSEDAGYRYNPYDQPIRGREAIVAAWTDPENRDQPGSFEAEYTPLAVEDSSAVAHGRTRYFKADGKTIERQYDNLFVLQFDDNGRCLDFCEWYMQPRGA